jgi:Zn-dependent peptidase ImmA (M78 family)
MTSYSFSHRIDPSHLNILKAMSNDVPVKVGEIARALGIEVVLATLPLNISGLIQPHGDGQYVIKVNRFESKERQRFTIAHEIAHFLIHKDQIKSGVVDSVLYRSKLSSRTEAEANRLAADIIMPNDVVYREIIKIGKNLEDVDVADLATKFGVSRQAMAIRIG